jgi:hypothetical protein
VPAGGSHKLPPAFFPLLVRIFQLQAQALETETDRLKPVLLENTL